MCVLVCAELIFYSILFAGGGRGADKKGSLGGEIYLICIKGRASLFWDGAINGWGVFQNKNKNPTNKKQQITLFKNKRNPIKQKKKQNPKTKKQNK